MRQNGTEVRRLTDGGKDNNRLGAWSEDGKFLTIASNRREAAIIRVVPRVEPEEAVKPVEGQSLTRMPCLQ
jgi:hypothetical protein